MIKVGITGGIGSGKSTVCKIFETMGIPVFYSDDEAKRLYSSDLIKKKVIELLGPDVYKNEQPVFNKISDLVFGNPEKLQKLNTIIHPAVAERFAEWLNENNGSKYVLKEAAILIESGAYKNLDKIITVVAPVETRIKRVTARDRASIIDIEKRTKAQITDEERIAVSDFVINNDGESLLIPQVLKIHETLIL